MVVSDHWSGVPRPQPLFSQTDHQTSNLSFDLSGSTTDLLITMPEFTVNTAAERADFVMSSIPYSPLKFLASNGRLITVLEGKEGGLLIRSV